MVTLKSAEAALKTVYLGTVTELLNTRVNPLLTKIQQTSSDVWGKEIRKAAKAGINGGIGAGDEAGYLPNAAPTSFIQFVTTLKNLYGQIEISDKAIRASADGRGAFTDLLNNELEDLLVASKFNLGRMLYGDGTGTLAAFTNGATRVVSCARNLMEGMVVDIYNATGTPIRQGIRISGVNRDTRVIRFENEGTLTIPNNAIMVIQGSANKEITGIGAIFSNSGQLYGVSRADHEFMRPYVNNTATRISDRFLQETIDRLELNSNSQINFLACANDVKYAYQEYLSRFKRNIDVMELAGGFKTLSFNGIPLVHDRFVENGTMFMLDTTAFRMHQLCDWRYLETENGNILRQSEGKPTYSATLVKYCDLICDKPNGQGRVRINTAPL